MTSNDNDDISHNNDKNEIKKIASGRMWFVRFVSSQRTKTKRVNETTFYALIQYFAIVLFECKECEDFMPAKHLMSLCFTFYQEVEVPGTIKEN